MARRLPKSRVQRARQIERAQAQRQRSGSKKLIRDLKGQRTRAAKIEEINNTVIVRTPKGHYGFYKYSRKEKKYKFVTWKRRKTFNRIVKTAYIKQTKMRKKDIGKLPKRMQKRAVGIRVARTHAIYRLRGRTKTGKKIDEKVVVTTKKQKDLLSKLAKLKKAPIHVVQRAIASVVRLSGVFDTVDMRTVDLEESP